ncbi:MAG: efflux RND transporter permease subunit [Armatimonadota bacterium]
MANIRKRIAATVQQTTFNIAKWSIENRYPVIAFYVAVVVAAMLAIGGAMPRRMMPYVESPMIGVVSMMPGLSAEEMELYISKPIEEQMVNIKNLRYLRSTSQDGFSIVSLEFNYGIDMQKALFDVQALMNVVQANLPMTGANLKPSWVLAIDPLNVPVLSLSLTGDERWTKAELRELADNEIVNRLKTVNNVYSVVPFGGYRRQLQVVVDRDKLAAYGLSILDVRNAVDQYNVAKPGGTLTSGPNEAIVRIDSKVVNAEDLLVLPLKSSTSPPQQTGEVSPATVPRTVYLRDVASVEDTHWERRSAYHHLHNGTVDESIGVSVLQDPDASSPKVIAGITRQLKLLEEAHPGIKFEESYNNAAFVDILFDNMFHELALAILLTGIAVLFFLGEWRGTLISLTTIPISMAMAIIALIPMGMTLDSSTLIGLLLVIGRLVDDSIIDIHAVERHLRMGKDAKTATIDGITEVRLAVIASTVVFVIALVPLLFSGGITQLMFVGLVWPMIFGLIASTIVSFTLTAIMAASLLKPHEELERERSGRFYSLLLQPFQRLLDRMEHGYERLIRWMLKHRFVNMARVLATIIIGFGFYYFIGSEMMPLADVGQAYGAFEMKPGTSFAATEEAVRKVEQIMLKHPEIEHASIEIGAESAFEATGAYYTGYAMPSVNAAAMMLTFSDKDDRNKTIWDVIDSVQQEALATIPGIRRFTIKEMGSDVMASSAAPVQLLVYGKDPEKIAELGNQVAQIARETKGMYQVATSWDLSNPSYEVKVDPVRASQVGLSVAEVADQAYYALRGGLTNEFWRQPNLRQNTVLVRYAEAQRTGPADLAHTFITTPDGRQLPLNALATVEYRQAPSVVEHDGLRRAVNIMGFYRPGSRPSMDLSMEVQMRAMQELNFPPGYGIETRGDMTQMMDSFKRLLIGLGLALFFIYLVLVAQFRGFLQPLQMIFSIPLELAGVFVFLFLMHQAFSTVSILGVIVLTGMDVTTAILLIDLIMKYREQGVPRDEAVATACPQRLRPILMTSIITIIALAPIAFFPKTGTDAYSPLATAVIGGLIVGTILSLLDIPILHTYADDFINIMTRVRGRLFGHPASVQDTEATTPTTEVTP